MRQLIGVLLMTVVSAAPVSAKGKHWHGDEQHGANCYFRREDVRVIREYYAPRYRSLPPGLAKKYYRTGQLPPGWQKKLEPIPVAVDRRLVVLPDDYRRGYIDGSVVVYSPRTHIIVDVVSVFDR